MQWGNIWIAEVIFAASIVLGLGYVKLPGILRQRKLARGFPWGYYPDQATKADPGYFPDNDRDFLHNTNAAFGHLQGFGDYGEFTGFGEMGEF